MSINPPIRFSHSHHLLRVKGGKSALDVLAFEGDEALSLPFSYPHPVLAKPVPQTVELTHIMSMNAVAVPPAIKMTSALALDETPVTTGTSKMLKLSGEYPLNTRRFTSMELKVSYWPDKTYPEEILQLSATMDS